jgi:hypothetical protein
MTIALLAALILVAVAHLVVLDRRDKRGFEERQAEREVMDRLLQRIQAPETVHLQAPVAPDLPSVNPNDDEDYWSANQAALEEMARRERELGGLAT